MPLPGYSPDLMAVEPLWRWLREDVTYQHCHTSTDDLIRRIAAFEADVNANPGAVADRLWVKDRLDPEEEKLRCSKVSARPEPYSAAAVNRRCFT
jgi:hypothetical protein